MKKSDSRRYYGWVLVGLLLGLALAVMLSLSLGVAPGWLRQAASQPIAPVDPVGALGPIILDWDQPAAPRPQDFQLDDGFELELRWQQDQLTLIPQRPLEAGEHRLLYQPAGSQGVEWLFHVRAADPLYLLDSGGRRRLYRWNNGEPLLLSENQQVADYKPSWQGERIAYAAANSQGGSDLWLVDRNGAERERLVSCGQDQCGQIAWTPAGDRITFSRWVSLEPDQSRLWTVDPAGGETAPLFQAEGRHGRNPVWSPDGRRLAYYDPDAQGVRLLDSDTLQEQVVPSRAGLSGAWSWDSELLYLPFLVFREEEPVTYLYQLEVDEQNLSELLGEQDGWRQVGEPALGLAGNWLALAGQRGSAAALPDIWLVPLTEGEARPLTAGQGFAYGSPSWEATGQRLLFQRFPVAGGDGSPDLLIWSPDRAGPELLVEGAGSADWLQ